MKRKKALSEVVAWAKQVLLDTDNPSHTIIIPIAQLRMSNVKAVGLKWKDLALSWK